MEEAPKTKSKMKNILYMIFHSISSDPTSFIISSPPTEICDRLNGSGKTGQGRANGNTTQEASFAYLLEKSGFISCLKKTVPACDGMYYIYQPNGTQQSPDFRVFYAKTCVSIWSLDVDMKQSNTGTIVLNDGWFNTGVVYILSYKIDKKDNVVVGLGQDIPSKEEEELFQRMLKIKRELNSGEKQIGCLQTYFRFANQYKCTRFNNEMKTLYLSSIKTFLDPWSI